MLPLPLLKELEKTRTTFWNITPETAAFLHTLIKDRKYKSGLEIGASNGYSGIWLADALSKNKGQLHTIESNKKRQDMAEQNFKKAKAKNITLIKGHAPEAIPNTPKKFDFIFFDATKYEHLSYFKILESRIKKGGVIVTDNIISHQEQLSPYIKHLNKNPNFHSEILKLGTGIMISHRL